MTLQSDIADDCEIFDGLITNATITTTKPTATITNVRVLPRQFTKKTVGYSDALADQGSVVFEVFNKKADDTLIKTSITRNLRRDDELTVESVAYLVQSSVWSPITSRWVCICLQKII